MITGLIGRKLGMTQYFGETGDVIPVSVLEAGPCKIVQVRNPEKNGYSGVQLSFMDVKESRLNKPLAGYFKKTGVGPARHLREFRCEVKGLEVGQEVRADLFAKGERVDVTGVSKGKGFAGVIKRHHFAGGPATHGSMFHRAPGSIGASSYPSRVWKNQRLPGQMGNKRITVKNLEVVEVRPEENLLLIRGAIPGSPGGLVLIRKKK